MKTKESRQNSHSKAKNLEVRELTRGVGTSGSNLCSAWFGQGLELQLPYISEHKNTAFYNNCLSGSRKWFCFNKSNTLKIDKYAIYIKSLLTLITSIALCRSKHIPASKYTMKKNLHNKIEWKEPVKGIYRNIPLSKHMKCKKGNGNADR